MTDAIVVEGTPGLVDNAVVYGLRNSVRRAKFPMSTDVSKIPSPETLSFWDKDEFIHKFVAHMDSGDYPIYKLSDKDSTVVMQVQKENGETVDILIDEDDVPKIFPYKWHYDTYCRSIEAGLMHRLILQDTLCGREDVVVDHINRDTADNRKQNLRLATRQQNGYNSKTRANNSSGVMGVSWREDRGKWRAYINIDGIQLSLGLFDNFEDAVRARLIKEREICGEFAPRRDLFEEYGIEGLENPYITTRPGSLKEAVAAYGNISRLSAAAIGTGHDQALTGVVVQFDLTFTNKAWTELQRYHFIDFVSSQSTMHRITKFDLDKAYSTYVDPRMIEIMKEKVKAYNDEPNEELKKERYLEVLYSNPAGFRLTAGMTTNYRQLKTIYRQRKNHRLPEWRAFCRWIETLPESNLITGGQVETD